MADYTSDEVIKAVLELVPNAILTVSNGDIDNIEWQSEDKTEPSKADIEAKIAEQKTAYDNLEYSRNRAREYPSFADQLDDIYHNGVAGWKTTIKVTKDKYPKP